MRIIIIFSMLAVMTGLIADGQLPAEAAELRPFVLPSTQREQPYQQNYRPAPAAPAPSVYERFEADVRNMSQEEKNQQRNHYQNLRNQSHNPAEQKYYTNLLRILNRY